VFAGVVDPLNVTFVQLLTPLLLSLLCRHQFPFPVVSSASVYEQQPIGIPSLRSKSESA
jgi:hypothetical protein